MSINQNQPIQIIDQDQVNISFDSCSKYENKKINRNTFNHQESNVTVLTSFQNYKENPKTNSIKISDILKNANENNNSITNKNNNKQSNKQFYNPKKIEKDLQILDYFIIDFNFDLNQYQILPKQNQCMQKCNLLKQSQNQAAQDASIMRTSLDSIIQINESRFNQQKKSFANNLASSIQVQAPESIKRLISDPMLHNSRISSLYEQRKVILNLIQSKLSDHLRQLKQTNSMTDLLKLTTNPSKSINHFIIPSFLQIRTLQNYSNCNRYTHILQTTQCIFNQKTRSYFQYQRFFVLIENQNRPMDVQKIVQGLNRKHYEIKIQQNDRFREDDQISKQSVKYTSMRHNIKQISLIPKDKLNSFYHIPSSKSVQYKFSYGSSLSQLITYSTPALYLKFSLQPPLNLQSKSFSLLIILIYFILSQYKIIFLTTKGYQHTISQIIMALTHMLGELRYIYPVILGTLNNHHIQFVNLPVPGLIGLWGKEQRFKKGLQYVKNKLKQEQQERMNQLNKLRNFNFRNKNQLSPQRINLSRSKSSSLSTLVIDMNKHQFVRHYFNHQQLYIIENLQRYMQKEGYISNFSQNKNLISGMNKFIDSLIFEYNQQGQKYINRSYRNNIEAQKYNIQDQNGQNKYGKNNNTDWIKLLKQKIRNTQMYEEYMKFYETYYQKNQIKINNNTKKQ